MLKSPSCCLHQGPWDYDWSRLPKSHHSPRTSAAIEVAAGSEGRGAGHYGLASVSSQLRAHTRARCRSLAQEETIDWGNGHGDYELIIIPSLFPHFNQLVASLIIFSLLLKMVSYGWRLIAFFFLARLLFQNYVACNLLDCTISHKPEEIALLTVSQWKVWGLMQNIILAIFSNYNSICGPLDFFFFFISFCWWSKCSIYPCRAFLVFRCRLKKL